MKILFICSCLEPGKDGVGDYTKLLGEELIKLNHQITFIALNDGHIQAPTEHNNILRLPKNNDWQGKKDFVIPFIKKFNPDWISLQFVIYGFHPKGLPFKIPKFFKKIQLDYKWHIMFHELWVGINTNCSFKEKLLGHLQKKIVKKTITSIKPKFITTNNQIYKNELISERIENSILQIFSNIPCQYKNNKSNTINYRFILFGGILGIDNIFSFVEDLFEMQITNNISFEIIFIGKNGNNLDFFTQTLKNRGIKFKVLGIKSPMEISKEISLSDIGIATTPYLLSQKSGTIATYLEHNLKVVSISNEWNYIFNISIPEIIKYEKGNLLEILEHKKKINYKNSKEIAIQFKEMLLNA